jgi:hypothetical protein
MATKEVYDPVKAHLEMMFPEPSHIVVDYDQIDRSLQQSETPIIALEELFSVVQVIGMGDPKYACERETGELLIHVFVNAPSSSNNCRNLAQLVQQAVQYQYKALKPLRLTAVNPPEPEIMNQGLWTGYGVLVSYQLDRHVAIPQLGE